MTPMFQGPQHLPHKLHSSQFCKENVIIFMRQTRKLKAMEVKELAESPKSVRNKSSIYLLFCWGWHPRLPAWSREKNEFAFTNHLLFPSSNSRKTFIITVVILLRWKQVLWDISRLSLSIGFNFVKCKVQVVIFNFKYVGSKRTCSLSM